MHTFVAIQHLLLLLVLGPLLLPRVLLSSQSTKHTHHHHIYTQKSRQRIGDSYCLSLDREGCQLKWDGGGGGGQENKRERRGSQPCVRRKTSSRVYPPGEFVRYVTCVCDGRYTHTHTHTHTIYVCIY